MTVLTSAYHHVVEPSLLCDHDYLAYWRARDDELTERYYTRGLTPPGMSPLPSTPLALVPPF